MRFGFIISLLLHTAVIVIAVVGLPSFNGESDPIPTSIPVSVISEADLARLNVLPSEPATLIEAPQIEVPEEAPPPKTEMAAVPPTPVERPEPPPPAAELPEMREPEPPPEAQLAPEPALPEPVPLPPPEPEPVVLEDPEPQTEPEPEPEPELEPEPEPEPEQPPEIAEEPEPVTQLAEDVPPEPVEAEDPPETQVAALPAPPVPPRRPEPPAEAAEDEPEPEGTFGSLLSSLAAGRVDITRNRNPSRLPPALEQAVRQTISRCWNIDPSAPGARETIVELRVEMRQDGTVADAQVIDSARYRSDAIFRSAADRARRAVMNSVCQPLPLPAATFDEWRDMTLVFDPKDFFF